MNPGWILPSWMSFSMESFAISRRMGLNPERTTALGVSSTMTSIPVDISNAWMLRPSRPMMRPFISLSGRDMTDVVVSVT